MSRLSLLPMLLRQLCFVVCAGYLCSIGTFVSAHEGHHPEVKKLDAPAFGKGTASLDRAIEFFRQRAQRSKQNYLDRVILGRLHYRRAQEQGDSRDYDQAEDLLRAALQINPNHDPGKLALSAVLMAHHQFADALRLAQSVADANPSDIEAWALIGDAQIALGGYDQATQAYHRLADHSTAAPVLARLAHLDEIAGHPEQAVSRLQKALETLDDAEVSPGQLAWYQNRIADLQWTNGQLDAAEASYAAVLKNVPDNVPALRGLASVRCAQQRFEEATQLYQQALSQVSDPHLYVAIGEMYEYQGDSKRAERMYRVAEQHWLHEQQVSGQPDTKDQPKKDPQDSDHDELSLTNHSHRHTHSHRYPDAEIRSLALFYADRDRQPEQALELAQRDLKNRQDIESYDVLAWTLYRNGRFEEASEAIKKALHQGMRQPRFFFHAGLIAAARGQHDAAIEYLSEAKSINPHFSLVHSKTLTETLTQLQPTD